MPWGGNYLNEEYFDVFILRRKLKTFQGVQKKITPAGGTLCFGTLQSITDRLGREVLQQ